MIRWFKNRRVEKAYKAHVNMLIDQGIVEVRAATQELANKVTDERHAQHIREGGLNMDVGAANQEREILLRDFSIGTKDKQQFDWASDRIARLINTQLESLGFVYIALQQRGALKWPYNREEH